MIICGLRALRAKDHPLMFGNAQSSTTSSHALKLNKCIVSRFFEKASLRFANWQNLGKIRFRDRKSLSEVLFAIALGTIVLMYLEVFVTSLLQGL